MNQLFKILKIYIRQQRQPKKKHNLRFYNSSFKIEMYY